MYNFNEIVGMYTIKHIIRKHKEQASAWDQNDLHRMKDNKFMRSLTAHRIIVYPPPLPSPFRGDYPTASEI